MDTLTFLLFTDSMLYLSGNSNVAFHTRATTRPLHPARQCAAEACGQVRQGLGGHGLARPGRHRDYRLGRCAEPGTACRLCIHVRIQFVDVIQDSALRVAIRCLLRSLKETDRAKCKADRGAEDAHDLVQWANCKCQELSGAGKTVCRDKSEPLYNSEQQKGKRKT